MFVGALSSFAACAGVRQPHEPAAPLPISHGLGQTLAAVFSHAHARLRAGWRCAAPLPALQQRFTKIRKNEEGWRVRPLSSFLYFRSEGGSAFLDIHRIQRKRSNQVSSIVPRNMTCIARLNRRSDEYWCSCKTGEGACVRSNQPSAHAHGGVLSLPLNPRSPYPSDRRNEQKGGSGLPRSPRWWS